MKSYIVTALVIFGGIKGVDYGAYSDDPMASFVNPPQGKGDITDPDIASPDITSPSTPVSQLIDEETGEPINPSTPASQSIDEETGEVTINPPVPQSTDKNTDSSEFLALAKKSIDTFKEVKNAKAITNTTKSISDLQDLRIKAIDNISKLSGELKD